MAQPITATRMADCKYWVAQCDRVLFAGKLLLARETNVPEIFGDARAFLDRVIATTEIILPDESTQSYLMQGKIDVDLPQPHRLSEAFHHGLSEAEIQLLRENLSAIQMREVSKISNDSIEQAERCLVKLLRALKTYEGTH